MTWLKLAGTFIAGFIGKIGILGWISKGISLATSFAFPGWSAIGTFLLGLVTGVFKWLWSEVSKAFSEGMDHPRVVIVFGLIALTVGCWHGYDKGVVQGQGDLETYKQEAVVYQQQADATAAAAKAAKEKAEAAERAKIAAEQQASRTAAALAEAKATADANAKALADAKAAATKPKRTRSSASSRAKKTVDPWSAWVTQIKKAFGT